MKNRQWRIALRPRTLDEIYDMAFLLVRKHLTIILSLWFITFSVVMLPFLLLAFYLISLTGPEFNQYVIIYIMFVSVVVLSALFQFPFIALFGRLLFEEKPALKVVFSDLMRSWSAYFSHVLFGRSLFRSFLGVLLVPLWPGWIAWTFLGEVVIFEKYSGNDLMRRMKVLASDGRLFAFRLLAGILFILAIPVTLHSSLYLKDFLNLKFLEHELIYGLVILLMFSGYLVFHSAARFLLYLDTRIRVEGWDLELDFERAIRETEAMWDSDFRQKKVEMEKGEM